MLTFSKLSTLGVSHFLYFSFGEKEKLLKLRNHIYCVTDRVCNNATFLILWQSVVDRKRLLTPVCPGVFMNKTKKRRGYMWDLYVKVFETN